MIKVLTPKFRVSFPQVFEPKAVGESTVKKYSITMLFDPAKIAADPIQKDLWEKVKIAARTCAQEKWGAQIPKGLKSPFRDGNEPGKADYEGYGPGVIFLVCSTKTKPGIVGPDKSAIIAPEEFYAGCWARATINPYAWTFMGKSGVSFGLQNIQKLADGEPFGGRTRAENEFDAYADLESADNADIFDKESAKSDDIGF